MRIDSGGNVGIGVSPNSSVKLQVKTATNQDLAVVSSSFVTGGICLAAVNDAYSAYTALDLQGSSIQFGTGGTERMRIDASGIVTRPYQPAFYAYNPGTGNVTETNLYDFPFNTTAYNIGSCYNTSTNRFVAPVAGVYHFSFNLFNNGGTGRIAFKYNGTSYNNHQMDCSTTTGPITESCTMYLNASDYVTVGDWQSISGKVIYMGHSFFSGFLVS
jgi:hypothetical protein